MIRRFKFESVSFDGTRELACEALEDGQKMAVFVVHSDDVETEMLEALKPSIEESLRKRGINHRVMVFAVGEKDQLEVLEVG